MSIPSSPSRPLAWALLSQSIWLPLLAIDLHDRWQSRVRDLIPPAGSVAFQSHADPAKLAGLGELQRLPGIPGPQNGSTKHGSVSSGLLLGSGSPAISGPAATIRSAIEYPAFGASDYSPSAINGFSTSRTGSTNSSLALATTGASNTADALAGLRSSFSRAELLGGPINLADLNVEAPIPALALAEQGRRTLSADPYASLPEGWREPMRRALLSLPTPDGSTPRIQNARHVHVPSRRISSATEVPLALQSDGSIDILSRPKEPAVIEEIRDWSAGQRPPEAGSVSPAVVHLHPVSAEVPLRPTAADLSNGPVPMAAAPIPESIPLDALGGEGQ